MSKKFDIITIVLMLVLIIVLFFVVFNYYTHPSSVVTTDSPFVEINTDSEIQSLSGSNTILKNNVVIGHVSGEEEELIETNTNSGDAISSGDGVIDTVYTEESTVIETDKNSTPEASSSDANTTDQPLIITSNDNISDKEKKEVLNELDDTLMELLDVIDSVQTIDESRLEIDESEVQQ